MRLLFHTLMYIWCVKRFKGNTSCFFSLLVLISSRDFCDHSRSEHFYSFDVSAFLSSQILLVYRSHKWSQCRTIHFTLKQGLIIKDFWRQKIAEPAIKWLHECFSSFYLIVAAASIMWKISHLINYAVVFFLI